MESEVIRQHLKNYVSICKACNTTNFNNLLSRGSNNIIDYPELSQEHANSFIALKKYFGNDAIYNLTDIYHSYHILVGGRRRSKRSKSRKSKPTSPIKTKGKKLSSKFSKAKIAHTAKKTGTAIVGLYKKYGAMIMPIIEQIVLNSVIFVVSTAAQDPQLVITIVETLATTILGHIPGESDFKTGLETTIQTGLELIKQNPTLVIETLKIIAISIRDLIPENNRAKKIFESIVENLSIAEISE